MAGAVLAGAISLTGLLAMTGTLRPLTAPDLSAEVHLSAFPLPAGFGIEPQEVADFLVQELTERAGSDIALRLALGSDGQKKLIEIAIPRLVNSVVVRDMITQIKPLANVLSVADFRQTGHVVVVNGGEAAQGVALTLPGLVLAQTGDQPATIETTSAGLTAVNLGDMAAGETRVLTLWLGEGAEVAGFDRQVMLGDAAGRVGRVWVYHQEPWRGSDLQVMPLARWLIGGVLLVVFTASLMTLLLGVFLRLQARRRPRSVNPA
jgi:hypothetical protein